MADAIDLIGTLQKLHAHAKVEDVGSFEEMTGASAFTARASR